MRALLLLVLIGISTGCATNPRTIHAYYGADSPFQVGNVTIRNNPITDATMLACEDGYVNSFNYGNRFAEEMQRAPLGTRGYNEELLKIRVNKYRRDFLSPTGSTTIHIPSCTIAWSSGYSHEFSSFSIDLSNATFPYEVTKDFERVMSGNDARDMQDLQARAAQLEKDNQEREKRRASYSSTPMQQPAPIQPTPDYHYQPPSLPTMPTVPFPSAPGRTTTICRSLSNGTVVCN